jgi:hypothetical protein
MAIPAYHAKPVLSRKKIIRWLKRYLACEVYPTSDLPQLHRAA